MYKPLVSEAMVSSALHTLRVRTIRGDLPGLEHIEALMAIRGGDLAPVPPARTIRFRKGELRRAVLRALRGRPMALHEIVTAVFAARAVPADRQARNRIATILTGMKLKGMVAHEGRLWSLAGGR